MPEGAEATAVDVSEDYGGVAAYDITITNGENEYQPGEGNPILVEITDPVIPESDNIELWHIKDNSTCEKISDFSIEEGKISFYASGFSVYQIVEADFSIDCTYDIETPDFPYVETNDPGWNKVTDLRVLSIDSYSTQGFYICFSKGDASDKNNFGPGRFLKDSIVEDLKRVKRKGVAVTDNITDQDGHGINDAEANFDQIIQSASSNGATRYFFEKNDDGTYYISYRVSAFDEEGTENITDYYITASTADGQDSLIFSTTRSNDAKWTITCDNGLINLYNSSKDRYWGPTYGRVNNNAPYQRGVASTTQQYKDKFFNIWYYVSETDQVEDPYGLDNKTYGLVTRTDSATGYALYNSGSGTTLSSTKLKYDEDSNDKYLYENAYISGWTFHWDTKNQYKISTENNKYIKIDSSGLSLVDDETDASSIAVIPGSGTEEGQILLQDPVSKNIIAFDNTVFKSLASNTSKPHYFNFVQLDNQVADPYGLDGKSYGLMYYQNDTYGFTILPEKYNDNEKELKTFPTETKVNPLTHMFVNFVTDQDDAVVFWTFESSREDLYYISADTENGKKYLKITSDGKLQLSDTKEQEIQVIPGSGDYAGMIQLAANGKAIRYAYDTNRTNSRFSAATPVAETHSDAKYFWLNFVEDVSMLIPDDFVVNTAQKVGVSEHINNDPDEDYVVRDEEGHNEILIYTRVWDNSQNKYRFYAIDHDGSLVECYERGDNIMWIGSQVNSLKWEFKEYLDEEGKPTNYYDLYNPYSGKYIVPQISGNQTLVSENSEHGINLPGRYEGEYFTDFIKWDDDNYAYAGINVNSDNSGISSCLRKEDATFYFATFNFDDNLTAVETVDNSKYGITMKMVDFHPNYRNDPIKYFKPKKEEDNNTVDSNCDTSHEQHEALGFTYFYPSDTTPGLLSTELGDDGYPIALASGSLSGLFNNDTTQVVNHLFINSTLEQSGYFEYDSCQNFATIKNAQQTTNAEGKKLYLELDADGNKVYKAYGVNETVPEGAAPVYNFYVTKELGTYDSGGNKPSLKHGQFLPYDDIEVGNYPTTNGWNLYDALQDPLSDTDPRKYERLHLINDADLYFGMELEASFIQTPNGKDNWNHPIIFEFTGDDDFWLYVDGELVIDLGGVHSALAGTVNFATGDVVVNGEHKTLWDLFYNNYLSRGHSEEEALEYVNSKFKPTSDGNYVFNDYTLHTMKIFYMERGGGASNLHLRFNISSVNPGSVMLTKQVETEGANIDGELDENLMQFPYQIWYATKEVEETAAGWYQHKHNISSALTDEQIKQALSEYVEFMAFEAYKTNHGLASDAVLTDGQKKEAIAEYAPDNMLLTESTPNFSIAYQKSARRIRYEDSFTDNSGLTYPKVFFLFPGLSADIRFPEDTLYYMIRECGIDSNVYNVTEIAGGDGNTNSSGTELSWTKVSDRPNVVYKNKVARNAFKPLRITKVLYDDNNQNITEDNELYSFRLYLTDGISDNLKLTYMYKYHVLDPNGNYCRWDTGTKRFVSVGESDLSQLQGRLDQITFETSINGAISKIPLGYTIEVPNLPLHSYFMVEERADETPMGCKYLSFSDHKTNGNNTYADQQTITLNGAENTAVGDRQCAGKVPDGETVPWVDVKNKRGWELHANKVWSDKDFVNEHDSIFTAVYVKDKQTGNETLLGGSIRELRNPDTEVWYYFDKLEEGYDFTDYSVYEIKFRKVNENDPDPPYETEEIVHPVYGTEYKVKDQYSDLFEKIPNGSLNINIGYKDLNNADHEGSYSVNYQNGPYEGGNENVRIDKITNTRSEGLMIKLFDMTTNEVLKGGTFVLKEEGSDDIIGEYVSDETGLVTVMYDFDYNKNYILTESAAPKGYLGVPDPIIISLSSENSVKTITVKVGDDDQSEWAEGELLSSQNELVAEVDVYNPKFNIKFKKVDGSGKALGGAKFAVYRCVKAKQNGVEIERMDYFPVENFDNLTSDNETGLFLEINSANDNMLLPGKYYLYESKAPANYIGLDKPVKFEISDKGAVTILESYIENGETKERVRLPDDGNHYLTRENQTYLFSIPNIKDTQGYYFDVEKIIYVDKNVHKRLGNDQNESDKEQKFIFLIEKLNGQDNAEKSFYVTLNCKTDITASYTYPFDSTAGGGRTFNADKTVTCLDGYKFPAAIWQGLQTIKVNETGRYRVTEVSNWSNTDYDFWEGSNIYTGVTGGGSSSGDSVIINVTDANSEYDNSFTGERPTASFTNSETEYAYLSSQAYAENTIRRS